jgi:CRISPR-associated protein Csc2
MAKTGATVECANLWQGLKDAPNAFGVLEPYLEPTIQPLIKMKTVQILLFREALDYLILRTEDTREINEVVTPSARDQKDTNGKDSPVGEVRRVAFLGGKQKSVESRELERWLRTMSETSGFAQAEKQQRTVKNEKISDCYLKDRLCLRCPRCGLFGATSMGDDANIKHRIEYSSAFSLLPYEEITDEVTFNAINDRLQTTGSKGEGFALGTRQCVRPGTLFASIVTLRSATPHELMLVLKVLLSARSYGAESRTAGDLRNHIVGIIGGLEEVLTPLEFTLECEKQLDKITKEEERPNVIEEAVSTYWKLCSQPSDVLLLSASNQKDNGKLRIQNGLAALVQAAREYTIGREFLERAYRDVADLRTAQGA